VRQAIDEVIVGCIQELSHGRERFLSPVVGGDTPLYGDKGLLDSLDLVTLVMAVEQEVETQFGVSLTLADEHALSRKHSPFRTTRSFAEYIEERVVAARDE
jgi:acyl carrier protein